MPITLDTPTGERYPVLRRRRLGETFIGAICKLPEQRDVLKDGQPVLKDNGKPRKELVVTMVTMPGTTMGAGLGDTESVPAPGDIVRVILKGGGFGAWIEADNSLKPRQVGDVVTLTSAYGQAYDASGRPLGGRIEDQDSIDRVPRTQALGIYGPLTIRRATPAEQSWVQAAEAAYHAATPPTVLEPAPVGGIDPNDL